MQVAEELTYNPFMRVDQSSLKQNIGLGEDASPVDVMHKVRQMKNNFKQK